MAVDAKRYFGSFLDKLADEQSRCIKSLLDGDYASAQKIGLRLCPQHPQYLLLSLFAGIPENKRLFLLLLKKIVVIDLNFALMLINDPRFSCDEIGDVVSRLEGDTFLHTVVRRDWFLRSKGPPIEARGQGPEGAGDSPGAQKEGETAQINDWIDVIDDFRLYQYAIDNSLEVTERNSANYKWYKMLVCRDQGIAVDMVKKSINFNDILEICKTANLNKTGVPNFDILLCYLRSGYDEGLLQQMVHLFTKDRSFVNHKILLALLIASRVENNLVLAFYLSFSAAFDDNYEIELIHLFLSRYFCFVGNTQKLMQKLDIKNIQVYNNAYIWSDPMIVVGDRLLSYTMALNKLHKSDICTVESRLRGFLDANRVGHSASLLKLRAWLCESVSIKEINDFKILADTSETAYSCLLGSPCRYLFDKLVAGHRRSGRSCLGSLFSHADNTPVSSILKNPYISIECPSFLRYFHSLTSKINKTID